MVCIMSKFLMQWSIDDFQCKCAGHQVVGVVFIVQWVWLFVFSVSGSSLWQLRMLQSLHTLLLLPSLQLVFDVWYMWCDVMCDRCGAWCVCGVEYAVHFSHNNVHDDQITSLSSQEVYGGLIPPSWSLLCTTYNNWAKSYIVPSLWSWEPFGEHPICWHWQYKLVGKAYWLHCCNCSRLWVLCLFVGCYSSLWPDCRRGGE